MRRRVLVATAIAACAVAAGCGQDSGETSIAPPPNNPDAAATGSLRFFAYGDTVTDELLDPFREQNPDLDLETASFNSNKAAAAKLAGGFDADVVEVCADEMQPLLVRGLIRPLDPSGIKDCDQLKLSDSDEIRNDAGKVLFAPASAGPHGIIVNTDEVDPSQIDSYTDLFDPQYAGRAAMESTPLTAIGVTAMALGMDNPMDLSPDQIDQVKEYLIDHRDQFRDFAESDASMVNDFKSGEVVIADGGRGTTESMIRDGVPPSGSRRRRACSPGCAGSGSPPAAQNIDAAYKLINYYASPAAQALGGESGFVVMNPKALPLMAPEYRETADPNTLDTAIPETQPSSVELYDRAWQEVAAG